MIFQLKLTVYYLFAIRMHLKCGKLITFETIPCRRPLSKETTFQRKAFNEF